MEEIIVVSEEDVKSMIQEWMCQSICIEDLAKIYALIISETNIQLNYMSEKLKEEIIANNNE